MPAVQAFDASPVAGAAGKWAKLPITNVQSTKWSEAKAAMLWAVPSFSDIWFAMMVDKDGELAWFTDEIETAATDDKFLYINPKFYFNLTLDEQLFVNSHEIEHAMYGHAGMMFTLCKQGHVVYSDGVTLPMNGELLNIAQDYVINDQLVRAKIGKMPQGGLHWPALINGDMNVLDAYRLLYKANGGKKGNPKPQPGVCRSTDDSGNDKGAGSGKPFDQLVEPGKGQGKTPNKAMSERSQSEWDVTIEAAMESAKLRGQLPANLERIFGKRLQPKADWRDLYMLAVSKKVGNDRYTWDRLEQQLAYRKVGAPGRTSYGCNLVVIAADTSGSITQRTLDVFLAETGQLLEQAKPRTDHLCAVRRADTGVARDTGDR